ncbi:MAG: hypothetical protein O3A25_07535 [Acidobacteria bacterium]|nr:hypothetical protein [Acidobacteriota bacterium]
MSTDQRLRERTGWARRAATPWPWLLILLPLVTVGTSTQGSGPATPWVEVTAPRAFDEAPPGVAQQWDVTYRVDATIRLPLLVARIPIVSRDRVGVTTFSARDFTADHQNGLRAYEFYAASFPERARGLNRLGFLREALTVTRGRITETAQFGVISSEREDTMAKADEVLDNDAELLPYSVIDSLIRPATARSRVVRLALAGSWNSAASLHNDVRPRWDDEEPADTRYFENRGDDRYTTPLAFLGGLQKNLQDVADAVAAGEDPRRTHRYQSYIHNGRLFRFEVRSVERDAERTRAWAEAGWLEDPSTLRRVEYRLRNQRGQEIDRFTLWVELRPRLPDNPFPPPHLPVAYEYEPGAYLRLRAVRVPSAAPGHP